MQRERKSDGLKLKNAREKCFFTAEKTGRSTAGKKCTYLKSARKADSEYICGKPAVFRPAIFVDLRLM